MNLIYKNEKPLFYIAATISVLILGGIIALTKGLVLLYIPIAYLIFLVAQSGFISHLKGNGTKVTAEHYPDLHARLIKACERVDLKKVPDMYLLRTGVFNALATKFLGRYFVVLFTDVVDALEKKPSAIDFYIGHELGHIKRRHLVWSALLFPAMFLPLLGAALRRAEEYTCDLHGAACCDDSQDITYAVAVLAAGNALAKDFDANAYSHQNTNTSEFWMSLHELLSDYPWLSKRLARASAAKNNETIKLPRRHFFAWFLSLFIPRTGLGAGLGLLLMLILVIFLCAKVAVPAYNNYLLRGNLVTILKDVEPIERGIVSYAVKNSEWPEMFTQLGYPSDTIKLAKSYNIFLQSNGVLSVTLKEVTLRSAGQYLYLTPVIRDSENALVESDISWKCEAENVDDSVLPAGCVVLETDPDAETSIE